ncbi:MAG: hypothetical protein ACYCXW_17775 [Solirubrobacteraceae bacterium]
MDPFAVVILVALTALVLWVWFRGRSSRDGSSSRAGAAARARHDPAQSRDALETEDLEQLLSATNARRRARGLPERTVRDAISELGDERVPRG